MSLKLSVVVPNQLDCRSPATRLSVDHFMEAPTAQESTCYRKSPGSSSTLSPGNTPKIKAQSSSTQGSKAISLPGLTSSIFVLEGFLLLANTRNHCYANSSLQSLRWSTQALRSGPLQPVDRLSKLVRITPEHSTLNTITAGWVFDGRQHDASEFLVQVFQNLQPMSFGSWETRSSVPEGIIVDEEGTAPIHVDSKVSPTVQQMIDAWTGQSKVHALLRATSTVCVALPRFVERTKIRERIALAETISLPVFLGHDAEVALCTYYLRSVILHIGSETTSGHYRALVGRAGEWFLDDDSQPPVSMPLSEAIIEESCCILFLEKQEAQD